MVWLWIGLLAVIWMLNRMSDRLRMIEARLAHLELMAGATLPRLEVSEWDPAGSRWMPL